MTRNRRSTRTLRVPPPPTANAASAARSSLSARDIIVCAGPCGSAYLADDIEVDHIIPLSQGGADVTSNLQLLCTVCHRSKTVAEGAIA